MFTKAPRYIPIVGGQFQRHGTGEFTAEIVAPGPSGDEGPEAVHDLGRDLRPHAAQPGRPHGADGARRRARAASRTRGCGRRARAASSTPRYGHDERTWSQPGFQQLIEQGIVWAVDERRAHGVAAAEDAGGRVRRRLQRPELREARPGAEVPDAVDRRPTRMKFIQTPAEFKLELFAQRADDRSSRSPSRSTSAAGCG